MKIKSIVPYVVRGGFRYWIFVKIMTDEGLCGWGDASDWDAPNSVAEAIRYLGQTLTGEDSGNIERIWNKNANTMKRMWGGIAWKAMSGIDTALWDIKGKALNVPVWQLLGGKLRDRLRLYWTHCGSARFAHSEHLEAPRIATLDDLRLFCAEVRNSGFTAIKTNLMALGGTALCGTDLPDVRSGDIDAAGLKTAEAIVGTFRDELGPDVGIALDTAFDYQLQGARKLARVLEKYDIMWLETETFDPDAQLELARSTITPIVHGESLYDMRGYLPFLQRHAQGTIMVDLSWNGVTVGKKIADLAQCFDTLVSPHNCHSPLTTYIASHYCASVKNFDILEFDNDDVAWRDKLLTQPFTVKGGYLEIPDRPGWGTGIIEEALTEYEA